ncbi:MAG: hypothetical protein ACRDTX_05375 [Pseudonocardiaceae bacterium]
MLAQYGPLPERLCYLVDLVLVTVGFVGVLLIPETAEVRRSGRLGMQGLFVPSEGGGIFVRVGVVVFSVFAASAAGQLTLERFPSGIAIPAGCSALVGGMGVLAAGLGPRGSPSAPPSRCSR